MSPANPARRWRPSPSAARTPTTAASRRFVRAYFATKKLDEFATDLVRRGKLPKPPSGEFSVGEVLQLLDAPLKAEREKFFGQRVSSLVEETSGAKDAELDPEVKAVTEMGLSEFDSVHRDDCGAARAVPPQVRHAVHRLTPA